jgi:tyrosine-protein kinase Etk/Wzc
MASKNQDETNELAELASDLWKNRTAVGLFLLLSGIIGIFAAYWIRPVYEVNALLQVETKGKSASAMMGDLGSLFAAASPSETEIELVKSRRVMGAAVETSRLQNVAVPLGFWDRLLHREGRLDLLDFRIPLEKIPADFRSEPWTLVAEDSVNFKLLDYADNFVLRGRAGETAVAPYAGDSVRIGVLRMIACKGQSFAVTRRLRLDAIAAFESAFSVAERGKKTGILEFTYQDIYPDRAMNVVNQVASAYLRQNVEQRSAEAEKTLAFLEQQIPDVKLKLDSAEAELNAYRSQVGSVDINTETRIVLEGEMRLQQQILSLEQRREEAVRLFHEEHPSVKTLDEQINNLRKELAGSSHEAKKLPSTQQEILRLASEVELDKLLYTNMLNSIQQLRLVAAGEVGSVRIVDYAEQVTKPVKPKKNLVLMVALFLGFCASIVYVSIKKKFHSGIKDSRVIERELGVSVYAKIPKGAASGTLGTLPLAVAFPEDVAVESMRTLRTSLEFVMPETGATVIVLSGLIPAVGKSFVSVNLAALFAGTEKRVLLIDADLRKGRLHKEFGIRRDQGLSEVLVGKCKLEECLHVTNVPSLSLLVAGKIPASPSELLGSHRYVQLLEKLKTMFDVIIVDTPPVMLVTDAMLVCRHSDQAILVVEYNRHSIDAIREGLALFTKGANESVHKSIVINKYVHSKVDGYGYKYGKY